MRAARARQGGSTMEGGESLTPSCARGEHRGGEGRVAWVYGDEQAHGIVGAAVATEWETPC